MCLAREGGISVDTICVLKNIEKEKEIRWKFERKGRKRKDSGKYISSKLIFFPPPAICNYLPLTHLSPLFLVNFAFFKNHFHFHFPFISPFSHKFSLFSWNPFHISSYTSELGTRNFFLSPQSQFRNLKEAPPQSQFRNFLKQCWSATATPLFRNRKFFWSPQLQVHNLRASFPQFSTYFRLWNSKKLYIFLPPGVFSFERFYRDSSTRFSASEICLEWFDTPNLWYESGIHMGSIHVKKNQRPKISCYCPFKASFWFP